MGAATIPTRIANFNAYLDENVLLGVTGEVKLPNLEAMSETISGAGIMGEIDVANPGHFGNLPVEIPFRTLETQAFQLLSPDGKTITLRGAKQELDQETSQLKHVPVKITMKGPTKGLDLGKFGVGQATESKITVECWYIKIEIDGKVLLELDKLNFVFILNDKDMLADIKPHM